MIDDKELEPYWLKPMDFLRYLEDIAAGVPREEALKRYEQQPEPRDERH